MKPYNRARFLKPGKLTKLLCFFFGKSLKEQTPLKGKCILLCATQTVPLQIFQIHYVYTCRSRSQAITSLLNPLVAVRRAGHPYSHVDVAKSVWQLKQCRLLGHSLDKDNLRIHPSDSHSTLANLPGGPVLDPHKF